MTNKTIDTKAFLCRGIRQDTGKWVEGYYICLHSDTDMHIIVDAVDGQYHQVIPETVGRYTGLTDKNGVKIFEGDIIKGKNKTPYLVRYSENIAGFVTDGTGVLSRPCMNTGTMNFYEVVGNLHDSPELLEEE